jgi:hypothetical protein
MLAVMPSGATRPDVWGWPHRGVNTWRGAASCRAAAGAMALACSGPPGAGRTLGTDLGTFGVEATRGTSECGPGALGSTARFAFDVELSLADTELFWDGRVGGRIGPELDFEFVASSSFELRRARGADAGCTIVREDLVSGVLEADASGALTAFSGEMRFDFAASAGSACTGEEQEQAELPRLPCRMSYELTGQRTRAPGP